MTALETYLENERLDMIDPLWARAELPAAKVEGPRNESGDSDINNEPPKRTTNARI